MLELTFLGSGNAFAEGGRYWSSFLANGRHLFDAPPTLLPHLKRLGRPLREIQTVFITHFHGDHFAGLPFLILEYLHLSRRQDDLFIIGPPGLEAKVEGLTSWCFPGATRDAGYRRQYIEARPNSEQRAGEVSFYALPMHHATGSLECFGYRARLGDKTVAYTGDTMLCPEIVKLAEGADVLVLDCNYSVGSGPEHMGLDDIREVRRQVAPEVTIILTHLNGEPDSSGLQNVIVAQDLATYCFR